MNWTAPTIFIHAANRASVLKAEKLAEKTGLPLANDPLDKNPANLQNAVQAEWRLQVDNNTLQLARPDNVSVNIDFINGKATQRVAESNFTKQPLARALGLHKLRSKDENERQTPTVIDATAGLGTDAWMIASLGCSVRLLEQSPVLCALLQHAIDTAQSSTAHATVANQLELIKTNSIDYLHDGASARADIIYLDPMYPPARKQALVKKGMQLLHELIGPDSNGPALLAAALTKANYRVVVKRPKGAPELGSSAEVTKLWSGQITQVESPNTRFDVYHLG